MADHTTSRRRVMTLGFLTLASGALQAAPVAPPNSPALWQEELTARLREFASWVRQVPALNAFELHCGVSDLRTWAGRPAKIAGRGRKVIARGNTLYFSVNGCDVRVVLHPLS